MPPKKPRQPKSKLIRNYSGKKETEARRKRKKQADKDLRRKGYNTTGQIKAKRKRSK